MNEIEKIYKFYIERGIKERLLKNYYQSITLLNIGLDAINYPNLIDNQIIIKGLYSRGVSLYQLQKIDLANNDFSKVLEIEPTYFPALFGKAISLYKLKQYKNAIPFFEHFIQLSPNKDSRALISAYHKLMICYDKNSNYIGAKKIAENIIEINPFSNEPLECLCRYYFHEKQWDELAKVTEKLSKVNIEVTQNASTLALCKCVLAQQNNDLKELEGYYLYYIENFSTNKHEYFEDWEKLGVIHNNYGCILAEMGDWIGAFEQFRKASENYEFNLECEKNLCISSLKLKDYEIATNLIQELIDGNGRDDAESWYLKGLVQIKLQDFANACESFKNASHKENSSVTINESYWRLLQMYQNILENEITENTENKITGDYFDKFLIPSINNIDIEL